MPADRTSAILAAATGYQALAAALVQDAVVADPGWFEREPRAAEFWLDVAGVPPEAFMGRWANSKNFRI